MSDDTSQKRRKRINYLWELLGATVVTLLLLHNANRPATSVRGPLKILTPPFTADKSEIIQELRDRNFQALDIKLNSYQKDFEDNVLEEGNLAIAFDAFAFTDASLSAILDQWVQSEPNSYPAHLARAKYQLALGWQLRETERGDKIPEQQLAEMKRLYRDSVSEAVAAIKLNPKSSIAYASIVEAAKGVSDYKTLDSVYAASLKNVPLSLSTRVAVITALRPRWGGSHEAMAKFAEEAQKYAAQNPRLESLKGFVDQDQGDIAWDAGKLNQAVRDYNKALEEGGDFALAYLQRGNVYDLLRSYNDALEDLSRANRLRPQDTFTLHALAYTYVHLNRPKDTLAVIQEYQQFAVLPSDLLSLEQWAQNFNAGSGQAVKIGGN